MLTAALQGLAVHVTPPAAAAAVQPVSGYVPNLTEHLSRLWQPASPDDDVLTIFVEVGKTGSTTVHRTFTDAVASSGASYCILDFEKHGSNAGLMRPCTRSAIVFGAGFGTCSALGLEAGANISQPFASPGIAP
jgi:hypothetical protein